MAGQPRHAQTILTRDAKDLIQVRVPGFGWGSWRFWENNLSQWRSVQAPLVPAHPAARSLRLLWDYVRLTATMTGAEKVILPDCAHHDRGYRSTLAYTVKYLRHLQRSAVN